MSDDNDKLDRDIERDEFKTNVLRLAADIYLRGMQPGPTEFNFRMSPSTAVQRATELVMAASDDQTLATVTAEIAKVTGYKDPLAE